MKTKLLLIAFILPTVAWGQIQITQPVSSGSVFSGNVTASTLTVTDSNPTAPNLTMASGATTLLNRQAADARYGGQVYLLRLASDWQVTGTTTGTSSESVVLTSGTYQVSAMNIGYINSGSAGMVYNITYTAGTATYTGLKMIYASASYGAEQPLTSDPRRNPYTNIANFSNTFATKTAVTTDGGILIVPSTVTMRFLLSQRDATDLSNPAILAAGSYAVFRRLP